MHDIFMRRCFVLAQKGFRRVGNNPMVGAVLVFDGKIIGEGYHQAYGEAHAEVNCIASVSSIDRHLIARSTLYVSLEPCCHMGKTPPCTDLIIRHQIPRVVISCVDINPMVRNQGIERLEKAGVDVTTGILEEEGSQLLHKFKVNFLEKRPFIALKWAQSKYAYAGKEGEQVWFSNDLSRVFAHKLRSEFEAIMVGSNTVLTDNPGLNNRLYAGDSPAIIIIDRHLQVPPSHAIFQSNTPIYLVAYSSQDTSLLVAKNLNIVLINENQFTIPNLVSILHSEYKLSSILVEGGPRLHQVFANSNMWDEAYVIRTENTLSEGIKAPTLTGHLIEAKSFEKDEMIHFRND